MIGLRYALGGRIDPRLQYALWALVLVRLLIPVNFGWAPSPWATPSPPWPPAPLSADSAAEGITVPSIQTADPAPAASPEAADAPISPHRPRLPWRGRTRAAHPLPEPRAHPLLWLVGMAAVALWLAGSNLRFARQLRRSASRWRWRGPAAPSTSPRPWSPPVSSAWPVRPSTCPQRFWRTQRPCATPWP